MDNQIGKWRYQQSEVRSMAMGAKGTRCGDGDDKNNGGIGAMIDAVVARGETRSK
jgi:hypothetical protein